MRLFARTLLASALLACAAASQAQIGEDWMAGKVTTGNPAITYSGAPIEIKYGHPSPPASVLVPVLQANIKRLNANSNGKLAVKEYGSGSLFGARDGFKGVRSGVGEWGVCYTTYEGRTMPLSRVWERIGRRKLEMPTCWICVFAPTIRLEGPFCRSGRLSL